MLPQLANMILGMWLAAAPAVLAYGPPGATSDQIAGPLIASFACIALWEATRPVRWVNLPLGLWTALAPWVLGAPLAGQINGVLVGISIAALSCLGGTVQQQFGGGWSFLFKRTPAEDDRAQA